MERLYWRDCNGKTLTERTDANEWKTPLEFARIRIERLLGCGMARTTEARRSEERERERNNEKNGENMERRRENAVEESSYWSSSPFHVSAICACAYILYLNSRMVVARSEWPHNNRTHTGIACVIQATNLVAK